MEPIEKLLEAAIGCQIDFVAVEKPRGTIIKKRKNDTVVVRIEVTQEELNAAILKAAEKHQKRNNLIEKDDY